MIGPAWAAETPAAPAAASAPAAPLAKPSLTVTTVQPVTLTIPIQLSANGSLAAWQESVIGAEANGLRLTDVKVNVGDRVRQGDVLATLQSDSVRAELAQAQASLSEAQANLQKTRTDIEASRALVQKGFISAGQMNQSQLNESVAMARVEAAEAMIQVQRVRLGQTQVRAPDAGVISARNATLGSVVGAGTELFRLIRQGRLEWRAEVTASEIGRVAVGAPVAVVSASGAEIKGRVRMIAPSVDPQTRNALVYVDLQEPLGSARAGMFARGVIDLGTSQALTLPQTAVIVRDGFSYTYQVDADQKVAQLKIQTGRLIGDRIEVLGGLPAGARVVASGAAFLNHGDRVRVATAP
ncbi:MAG: efflux RND transporter periplasmic adaptor subunit [Betaproteobacteria bacterium]|nr:efflux RND transporter periplasmic adaptor subunit [Betaproteobacteria bacterium]